MRFYTGKRSTRKLPFLLISHSFIENDDDDGRNGNAIVVKIDNNGGDKIVFLT